MSDQKTQIPYLHVLRIIAILMVIMLHCVSLYISVPRYYGTTSWYAYLLLNAVSRGGVPLFFMISGYLLLSDSSSLDFKSFYSKRLPRILIPLVIWNIIYYAFHCIFMAEELSVSRFLSKFLNNGAGEHLWYIYTLAGIYLLTPFLKRIVDSCSMKALWLLFALITFCTTVRPIINQIPTIEVFFFDPLLNGYVGFFLLGYLLGKTDFSGLQTALFSVLGLVGIVVCMIFNDMASSEKAINLVYNSGYNICFYAIAVAIFCLAKKLNIKSTKALEHFSKITFAMYLVHLGVMQLIHGHFIIDAPPVLCTFYLFALTVPISYVMSVVISKIKYLA